MPTPSGLPKVGEVWLRRLTLPDRDNPSGPWKTETWRVTILDRGNGSYWSVRVRDNKTGKIQLWVDASYWWSKGDLIYCSDQSSR